MSREFGVFRIVVGFVRHRRLDDWRYFEPKVQLSHSQVHLVRHEALKLIEHVTRGDLLLWSVGHRRQTQGGIGAIEDLDQWGDNLKRIRLT